MGLYVLKYPYRKILLPLAKKIKWINPDILGYLALFITLLSAFFYYYADQAPVLLLWAIVITLFRMTLNTIDGVIAMERGNLRLKGEIVNALPDRYADFFLAGGIALSPFCRPFWGILGIGSMFLVSYTGMLGKALGVNWQHHGPAGKVERLILIMLFTLFQYLGIVNNKASMAFFNLNLTYLEWCMLLFLVLGQATVFNRLKGMLREIKKLEWIKYEKSLPCKILVLYDSHTGNTKKVAENIAQAAKADVRKIEDITAIESYDFIVIGTPNIRGKPTPKMIAFLEKNKIGDDYAFFITSGMPVWRYIAARKCLSYITRKIGRKPLLWLSVKGYHHKYKTYKEQPNELTLLKAFLFGIRIIKKRGV